jgi:hypothetical protein
VVVLDSTPSLWPLLSDADRRAPSRPEIIGAVVRAFTASLRPWPKEALQGFDLPTDVEAFLVGCGLPLDAGLPLVRLVGPPLHWRREGDQRLVVIGGDDECELRMREGSGEIVSARPFRPLEGRFVNSSAIELLECLRRYAERREELGKADEEGALNIASDLRAAIGLVDPPAVEPETWWSRVLDRAEAGFL